ncbi:hypothetical protein BSLG_005608 [Batrachochytrium salamandrivorans]|nr:hypothetical protein BSLG_005608 [Batrachochytrium salamandrivorans]
MEFCPVKTNTSMSNVRIPGGGSTQSLKLVNMYGSISRMSAVEVPIVTVDAPKESDTAVEASTKLHFNSLKSGIGILTDLKNTTWTTLNESTSPAQSLPRAAQAYLSAPVTLSSSDLTKIKRVH